MSSNQGAVDVNAVQAQVDEVTGIMKDNIEKTMANQENLEQLENKTDNLRDQASTFQKKSTQLKKRMWWRNAKLNMIIAAIVIVIILIIVAIACSQSDDC